MNTLPLLKEEFQSEYNTTKKFLAHFPDGKNDYAPHEKSMKLMPLAEHIAHIFSWPEVIMDTEVLDFAKDSFEGAKRENAKELQDSLEEYYQTGMAALNKIEEKDLEGNWAIAHDGHTIASWTKYGAIRHGLNQITHHRAQLGVYYRLLGIEVPSSYGPSADEQSF